MLESQRYRRIRAERGWNWADWFRTAGGDVGNRAGRALVGYSPSCIWEQEAGFSPTNTKQQQAVSVRACKSNSEGKKEDKIKGEARDMQGNKKTGCQEKMIVAT